MSRNSKKFFFLFLAFWTVLNFLQAGWTGLDPDEAYYWMYSRQLDWGYFDHPPMVALMIRAGYSIFSNTVGVRLITVLLQSASFYLLWRMVGRPEDRDRILLFAFLLAAMPMLEVYGFITTPDSPLLFFTVLFFFLYRRFLERDSWRNTLALGVCMAALLYSKYHGILVIGFTLLSNPGLLRRPRFYIASVFGAALFFPHLYWQYANDFPSFRYHLKGRDDPYELKHTVTYFINQLVVFNPLLFPFILVTLLRKKRERSSVEATLERAFYFMIGGFWLFFFWTTFKGHVEPQWTAVLSIPFVVLTYRYAIQNESFGRRLRVAAIAGTALLLLARIALVSDAIPLPALDFGKHREWTKALAATAGARPVLFMDSYRDPSLYAFYTKNPVMSYTSIEYRPNQYDLWNFEQKYQGREILFLGSPQWDCQDCNSFEAPGLKKTMMVVDHFQAVQKLRMNVIDPPGEWQQGEQVQLTLEMVNPYPYDILLQTGSLPVHAALLIQYAPEEWKFDASDFDISGGRIPAGSSLTTEVTFRIPGGFPPGEVECAVGIQLDDLLPSRHSSFFQVRIR